MKKETPLEFDLRIEQLIPGKKLEDKCSWRISYESGVSFTKEREEKDKDFKCHKCDGYDINCRLYYKKGDSRSIIVRSYDGKTIYCLKDGEYTKHQNLAFDYFGNGRKKK